MRGKKKVVCFLDGLFRKWCCVFSFFLPHYWIKNFRRNTGVVYFHRPCVCRKNKWINKLDKNTTTTNPTHTQIFCGSRARRSDARSVACTLLSPSPHMSCFLCAPENVIILSRKGFFLFFFFNPPILTPNTHIYPPRMWARQFAVAHSSSPLS